MAITERKIRDGDTCFAEKMARVRKARGLSQRDLSATVDIATSGISKIEKGDRTATIGEALLIADALDVSLDEMSRPGTLTVTTDIL